MSILDRPFLWIRNGALCYRFTLFIRILLAAGFIPTGMVKLLGRRFTTMGVDTPIGAFFEAMYQTGVFWRFIGLTQVVAGVLLLIPRFAHLGAAIFLPVMTSIFLITVGLGFGGTTFITGPMLLAVLWLILWDYHRFRPLLTAAPFDHPVPQPRLDPWEFAGFATFALCLIAFFGATRILAVGPLGPALIALGFGAGLFTAGRFLWVWARARRTLATG